MSKQKFERTQQIKLAEVQPPIDPHEAAALQIFTDIRDDLRWLREKIERSNVLGQ